MVRIAGEIHKPASVKQLACRQQMKVVINFLNPIIGFINPGFLRVAEEADKQAHNMAVSYNKRYALQGSYPDITVDYTKALVTQGKLRKTENAQTELMDNGIKFTWDTDQLSTNEKNNRVMMMAYFPVLELAIYIIDGAKRKSGADILPLNPNLTGEYMETYISFISTPGNEVANSVYTGSRNASQ